MLRALGNDLELFQQVEHVEARHATPEELSLCHGPEYIRLVAELASTGGGSLDPDTVVSDGSWDAATAAAGAVLDGVDMAMDARCPRSFCAVRPPGHHALADRAMGFCLFGNVALGAHYARRKHGLERVLIVDWDVHHGNGTQALVENDTGIRFVSMHQWPWYPGTGAATDKGRGNVWNVPMRAGLAASEYTGALLSAIDAATTDFTPDLVLVSAGFDSLKGDPLGGFTWEPEDFRTLTRELVSRANSWCGGRIVSALEGGYDPARVGEGAKEHMKGFID